MGYGYPVHNSHFTGRKKKIRVKKKRWKPKRVHKNKYENRKEKQ